MRYSNGSMITIIFRTVVELSKPDSGLSLLNNNMTNEQTTWQERLLELVKDKYPETCMVASGGDWYICKPALKPLFDFFEQELLIARKEEREKVKGECIELAKYRELTPELLNALTEK
jgi:hypothetical protein